MKTSTYYQKNKESLSEMYQDLSEEEKNRR